MCSLGTQNCSPGTQNCSPGTRNCSPGTQHGVLEAGPGVLEAGLGGLERLLGDCCVLLNGLGRFQNALGTFQEAPERESLIFHWFLEVFWGGEPRRGVAGPSRGEDCPTPQTPIFKDKPKTKPKTKTKTKTKHVWNTLARLRASAVADTNIISLFLCIYL